MLGHTRLAIQGLGDDGIQPRVSDSGRFVIVFNGEIYNHFDLRVKHQSALNRTWKSGSDLETLLALIDVFGLQVALRDIRGMFAIALWDRRLQVLTLARDYFGEKPLYWGIKSGVLIFSSELKALAEHPNFDKNISARGVSNYLSLSYVPSPMSIYEDINKLPPGSYLQVEIGKTDLKCAGPYKFSVNCTALSMEGVGSQSEVINAARDVFEASVRRQLTSEKPVCSLLSGGVDSSLVTAVASQHTTKLTTFTAVFNDLDYDESVHAANVARQFDTEHNEVLISERDCIDVIPKLSKIYDEPFADSSQIPAYLVFKAISQSGFSVALGGDGADELFGGYTRHVASATRLRALLRLPTKLRQELSKAIERFIFFNPKLFQFVVSKAGLKSLSMERVLKLLALMKSTNLSEACGYLLLTGHTKQLSGDYLFDGGSLALSMPSEECKTLVDLVMRIDVLNYLPDDILVKVDRAAMASSVEARSPMLDIELYEFAKSLPMSQKVQNNTGKVILRKLLSSYIPAEMWDRPKQGFSIPLDKWLRGSLRPWVDDMILTRDFRETEYFDTQIFKSLWGSFLKGNNGNEKTIWNIVVLLDWLRSSRETGGS